MYIGSTTTVLLCKQGAHKHGHNRRKETVGGAWAKVPSNGLSKATKAKDKNWK